MPNNSRTRILTVTVLLIALSAGIPQLQAQARAASSPAATPTPTPAPQENTKRVQDVKFFSKTLQREMNYRVNLPKDYFSTEIRYPVLYLMHGYTGHYRSFEAHSNLTRYLERYQLIVVSIEAENSWLINSATNPKEKWEDYFVRDVISDAQDRFRINGGDARAIAGISSGGYAAVNLALKYPGLFFFAGSLSGPLDATRNPAFDKFPGFADVFALPAARRTQRMILLRWPKKPNHSTPASSL
jgi:S-formylglutathione hydrolase FrmB